MAGSVSSEYTSTVQGQLDRISDAKSAIVSALQNCGVSIPGDVRIDEIASYIEGLTSSVPYTRTIAKTDWVTNSAGGYKFSISAATHGKGLYPMVKTYTHAASTDSWEETYDSPEFNSTTGNVVIYSNVNDPLLVVIK